MNHLSPFGAPYTVEKKLSSSDIIKLYQQKCGRDFSRYFTGVEHVEVRVCKATGMKYYHPRVAGDEDFYRELSSSWPTYYRETRWEYEMAARQLQRGQSVLEVGCGRGYFLRMLEDQAGSAVGLELNKEASQEKVTKFPICIELLEEHTPRECYDVVYGFQILEHVVDARKFLENCIRVTRPGGRVIVSTPNHKNSEFARYEDPFDMPPHHINQFTPKVYHRIAELLGLSVELIEEQPGQFVSRLSMTRLLNRKQSPGHTVLAVLKRT